MLTTDAGHISPVLLICQCQSILADSSRQLIYQHIPIEINTSTHSAIHMNKDAKKNKRSSVIPEQDDSLNWVLFCFVLFLSVSVTPPKNNSVFSFHRRSIFCSISLQPSVCFQANDLKQRSKRRSKPEVPQRSAYLKCCSGTTVRLLQCVCLAVNIGLKCPEAQQACAWAQHCAGRRQACITE